MHYTIKASHEFPIRKQNIIFFITLCVWHKIDDTVRNREMMMLAIWCISVKYEHPSCATN